MADQLVNPASSLHLALLIGFVCVSALLMLLTVANRMRLRRVVRSWPAGRLGGVPVAPLLFLGAVSVLVVHGIATARADLVSLAAGYLVGGCCWLTGAYYAHSVVVTEFGLVTRLNRVREAVAWGQVADYFQVATESGRRYVFFYTDATDARLRLTLDVPERHAEAFDLIVRAKLDARFEFTAAQVYGRKALEGGA